MLHLSKEQRFPNNRLLGDIRGKLQPALLREVSRAFVFAVVKARKHRALGMGHQSSNSSMAPTLCLTWKLLIAPGKP